MTLSGLFLAASLVYGLPPGLLDSVCYVETAHNTRAYTAMDGGSPSIGVCQIKLKTARHMGFTGTDKELLNARVNIEFSARYLAYQLKRYRGDFARAVTAYNQGRSNSHGGSAYLAKVFNQWAAYEGLKRGSTNAGGTP